MLISESARSVKWSQLALRKFHLFTGLEEIGSTGLTGMINEGLCCDLGNGSRTVRCGDGPSKFTKARSGLEVVFHRQEWKLSGSLESYRRCRPQTEAQSSSADPSGLVERYPHVVLWQLKSCRVGQRKGWNPHEAWLRAVCRCCYPQV